MGCLCSILRAKLCKVIYMMNMLKEAIIPSILDNVTNGWVAWLIKCGFRFGYWIYPVRLKATTNYNCLKQFLQ
jgi:hypothetical protein